MLRSLWKGALIVALAWAGAVVGQPPTPKSGPTPPPVAASPYAPQTAAPSPVGPPAPGSVQGAPTGQPEYRTVEESDRPPLKCRVLRCWRMPTGAQACELECMATGEMLTLVETGPAEASGAAPGSHPPAMAARIFHWGRHKTRPAGFPVPPGAMPDPVASRPESGPASRPATVLPEPPRQALLPSAVRPPSSVATQAPASRPVTQPSSAQPAPRTVVEAPRPSEWRQSWGGDDPKPAPKPAPEINLVQAPPSPPKAPELPRPPASTTQTSSKPDPLANPQNYISRSLENKMPGLKPDTTPPAAPPRVPAPPPAPPVIAQAGVPAAPPQAQVTLTPPQAQAPLAPPPGQMPLGAQSVLAASSGLERPVQYVPVPIITMPERRQLPLPPVPQIPQAPQPNEKFVNAFTPPMPPGGEEGAPGYPPNGPMGYGMMPPGYPMMPPGYNPMMAQARYPMHPGMMPPGYGMQQAGYNSPGYGPMMPPGYVPGRGMVPYGYQGPMPPNPFMGQPMPAGPVGQARNPAMDRPAVQEMTPAQAASVQQVEFMIYTLTTSVFPSQREWSAHNLAMCGGHSQPRVVQVLTTAARSDPAPTVRASCVHALARMQATGEPVMSVLRQLKSDTDPRVRVEAEQALTRLSPSAAPAAEQNPVQPAGGVR